MKRRAFLAAALIPALARGIQRIDGHALRTPMNLVFEGDSLTDGSGLAPNGCQLTNTCPDAWTNQLLSELAGKDVTHAAFASDSATLRDNIVPRASSVDAAFVAGKLNVLTLWAGTNDIMLNGSTGRQTYDLYAAYLSARIARGWIVLPFTLLPRLPRKATQGSVERFEAERYAFNALVRSNFPDRLVDVACDKRIGDKYANLDWTYYFDQVHMTAAGYAIVKDLALLQLQSI